AGEVLPTLRDRLPGLRVELDDALLELGRLELKPLLGRDDVGDPALDVLQELELLFVRVVESLGRILRSVEQLRELRLYHRGGSFDEAGHRSPSSLASAVSLPAC